MPRTSGVTPYWVRRESGGGHAANTGRFTMALSLSGTGSVTQNGSGGMTLALHLAGAGGVTQAGAGALTMSLTLSGTGSVVVANPRPARPVITHLRRRTK